MECVVERAGLEPVALSLGTGRASEEARIWVFSMLSKCPLLAKPGSQTAL